MIFQRSIGLLLVASVLGVLGCTQTMPPPPKTYRVFGKVALADGQPLTVGVVHLTPKGKTGVPAEGRIDSKGNFSISAYGKQEGAIPGEYLLSVDKYSPAVNGPIKGNPPDFPDKYTNPTTSELKVEVKSQDNDVGTITLK